MSGTRFSGIAVAAANRRALVNQEREAAQRDAAHVKTLNAKEEALLASIRNQLLGGGEKKRGGGGAAGVASEKHRASSKGSGSKNSEKPKGSKLSKAKRVTADGVEQYDDLDDLEDDEDEGRDAREAWDGHSDGERAAVSGGERASPPPPAGEKRFMSKAERKRLKKQRMHAKVTVGGERAEPANAPASAKRKQTGSVPKNKESAKRKTDDKFSDARRKKKKNRAADAPRPPSPTWPPR